MLFMVPPPQAVYGGGGGEIGAPNLKMPSKTHSPQPATDSAIAQQPSFMVLFNMLLRKLHSHFESARAQTLPSGLRSFLTYRICLRLVSSLVMYGCSYKGVFCLAVTKTVVPLTNR